MALLVLATLDKQLCLDSNHLESENLYIQVKNSIGQCLFNKPMRKIRTFGLEIDALITFSYIGRNKKDAGQENGAEFVSFEDLLKISDFVIITCSYSPDLHKKFNKVNFTF